MNGFWLSYFKGRITRNDLFSLGSLCLGRNYLLNTLKVHYILVWSDRRNSSRITTLVLLYSNFQQ